MLISPEGHERINAAVTRAESASDGEIVTMVAHQSDDYAEWAMLIAALAGLAVPALLALIPGCYAAFVLWLTGSWHNQPSTAELLGICSAIGAIVFILKWLALRWMPLRLFVVPGRVKQHRVRAAAIRAYRIGIESRTRASTGVLIYLSLAEHRAEIVADAAITDKVGTQAWGEAMSLLIADVRAGRPADGIIAAVDVVGTLIATHFPRSQDDTNELPDRLIEL